MKSFVISLVLLAVVVAGVIINIVYMKDTCDELISAAGAITDKNSFKDDENDAEVLRELWDKSKKTIRYIIDYREIECADKAFAAMESSRECDDYEQYRISLGEFIHAVKRMKEISEITPDNIL